MRDLPRAKLAVSSLEGHQHAASPAASDRERLVRSYEEHLPLRHGDVAVAL